MASSMNPNIADHSASQRGSENGRWKKFTFTASILEARNFTLQERAISWKYTSVHFEDLMSAISQPVPVQSPPRSSPPPAPAQPTSRGPWKLLVILALIGIGGYAAYQWFAKPQPVAVETAVVIRTVKVTTETLERTIRLTGQTSARQFANVIAPILRGPEVSRDLVLMKLAPSGALVKKGSLLAQIDGQSMQDHVDDLGDTIQAAEADVNKRKAEQAVEYEGLLQTVRVAKSEFDKAKLDASAAEVRTDIEQQLLKLSLEEAAARYKQVQGDLASKQASQKAEIKILELTRERHIRHRNRHVVDVARCTIYAPMDGLTVMSPIFRGGEMAQIQQGDRVSPGQQFMKIVRYEHHAGRGNRQSGGKQPVPDRPEGLHSLRCIPWPATHGKGL